MFAFLHNPPSSEAAPTALAAIAADFSPRFEMHGAHGVAIDISGLERMFARRSVTEPPSRPPSVWDTIGNELRRAAVERGLRAHVAVASTWTAAAILAHARPGLTVVERGREASALATIRLEILKKFEVLRPLQTSDFNLQTLESWGIRTLGEFAALPGADLASRLGREAPVWQAMARGDDRRPLVPMAEEERFESSMELDWPIDGLEPLSFVLTRLLEPLSMRLERRDRGAAVLHVMLGLTSREVHARRLELPAPMRDVRALRTLALLDLESQPPATPIDVVTIVIEPTPGRILQHTLFARAHPTPERVSTLLARLGALMGQDRIGAPTTVDSYRPGAFVMKPFAVDASTSNSKNPVNPVNSLSSLRRCRQPVPARVAVDDGRPVRVTTDRRGFAGGDVLDAAGPWRTSGNWWAGEGAMRVEHAAPPAETVESGSAPPVLPSWDRDEWDVALGDGGIYRIFRDRETDAWFIDAIVD
jgi:protein ImuB